MSEAFLGKEKDLKNKISLESSSGGIKVLNIDDYLEDINKRFKRIIKEVTNEAEAKLLFLDFIALKNNIDEVYMPSGDMDEYTLDRMNQANISLCEIYGLILSKSPTIYTSQIQYLAYNSLFDNADHMIFYRHLFDVVKDNFEVARYTVGVFKEIIFVHYDLDVNDVIKDNVTELIELLTKLCNDANLDVNEELEGLIN